MPAKNLASSLVRRRALEANGPREAGQQLSPPAADALRNVAPKRKGAPSCARAVFSCEVSGLMRASSPQERVVALLTGLIAFHGLDKHRETILSYFRDVTAESLGTHVLQRPRASTLTSDGVPFEVAISLAAQGTGGLCYGTECGDLSAPFADRLARSNRVIQEILENLGARHVQEVHQTVMDLVFPVDIRRTGGHRFGVWVGMSHRLDTPDRLKVYYNVRPTWKAGPGGRSKSFLFSRRSSTFLVYGKWRQPYQRARSPSSWAWNSAQKVYARSSSTTAA